MRFYPPRKMIGMSETTSPLHVLVTGASGFLGRHVVHELLDHGMRVTAAGRNSSALEPLKSAGADLYVGDLASLATADLDVDAIIHCAALSSPWGRWRDFEEANVHGTRHVVTLAQRCTERRNAHYAASHEGQQHPVRVVFVSSPSVYAAPRDRHNISEDQADPKNRLNHYIRSKILAEQTLQSALKSGELEELVIVRPRGLIGVGDPSLLPRLLDVHRRVGIPLFNSGRNLVDLTSVENVALALRLAMTAPQASGQVYNITNDDPRPMGDLLRQLLGNIGVTPRLWGAHPQVVYALAGVMERIYQVFPWLGEPSLTRYTVTTIAYSQTLDISRAREELGYEPRIGLDESLARFAQLWKEQHGE